MRCDAAQFEDMCPLALLSDPGSNDILLHHTITSMAGPDAIFPAIDEAGNRRIVILHLKHEEGDTLQTALKRLDMGCWYPERPEGRANLRAQLAAVPSWAQPIRVVLACHPVDPRTLHAITYFNLTQLQTTPILLVQPTPASFGVSISLNTSDTTVLQDIPACLWPSRVPELAYQEGFGLPPPPAPDSFPCSTLRIKLSDGTSANTMEARVHDMLRGNTGEMEPNPVTCRHFFGPATITVTVTHLQGAVALVQAWRAAGGRADFVA
jgi:hypothetical protein